MIILYKKQNAFSLAEVIAALTIVSMVMMTVLTIYSRANRVSLAISENLDTSSTASQLLERIAEDIDKMTLANQDVTLTFENKTNEGFHVAQLTLSKPFYNLQNEEEDFEKIIYRPGFDYDSDANGLVMYRSHQGIASEDQLLHGLKDRYEREMFIPFCEGMTYFNIAAVQGEELIERWTDTKLPKALEITVSFAPVFKAASGLWEVYDEDKVTRVIAVDKTRNVPFYMENTIDPDMLDDKDDANALPQADVNDVNSLDTQENQR